MKRAPAHGPSPELAPGASTVETEALQELCCAVDLCVAARRNLLLTGLAGCGKTHAVRYILQGRPFYEVRFGEKLNRRQTIGCVHRAVTGKRSDRTQEQMEEDLFVLLREPVVLVLEEVQYLDETQMHLVRVLYDRPETEVTMLFVGEPEALELVERVESLGSRIPIRLLFDHLVADEVPENLRLYHPMYEQLSDAELLALNRRHFGGEWRDIDSFTALAVPLLASETATLSEDVIGKLERFWKAKHAGDEP